MNLTAWVDVAIGLTVVYLGTSLLVTVINEYIAQALNLRGRQLREALKTLISDQGVRSLLTKDPVLKPFFDPVAKRVPSYVDPNMLARLLVGSLSVGPAAGEAVKQVSETIDKLPESGLKTQLQALVRTAGSTTDQLVRAVGEWADSSLAMLGESYKRNMQTISFCIGLAVSIGLNLDTVALTEHLYRDKDARDATVAVGVRVAEMSGKNSFEECMALTPQKRKEQASCAPLVGLVDAVQGRNESIGKLPIGWPLPDHRSDVSNLPEWIWMWVTKLVGWLMTALALSLGAPFWFDLLNKLVNMRHGMRKPEVSETRGGR